MGVDLAAAVGGFTLVGYLVDRHWEVYPRFTVVGAILGLIGGMYNLIRQGLAAARGMNRRTDADSESGEEARK